MQEPIFSVVGTAYKRRIDLVRKLMISGANVEVMGSGWPDDLNPKGGMGRLATLRWLKEQRRIVLNYPHQQMDGTLNPFFFDLAGAGVPQIWIGYPRTPDASLAELIVSATGAEDIPRLASVAWDRANHLQSAVLAGHSLDQRLEDVLER